jgi:hypothetical protein
MESRPVAATLPFYRAPPYGHAAHSKSCFTHRFTQYFGIIFSLNQKNATAFERLFKIIGFSP